MKIKLKQTFEFENWGTQFLMLNKYQHNWLHT
jgi:hypothetical protein